MRTSWVYAVCGGLVLSAGLAFGEEPRPEQDNPPIPSGEIKHITISIFPDEVIVVRGKMVELANLREHLGKLVPDARKPGVEVTVVPNSKKEMDLVPRIIQLAKEVGYTNVSYISATTQKPKLTELTILLSKTGELFVEDTLITEKELKGHLEKLVEEERRPKVRVFIRASRLVPHKKIAEISKLCQSLGFKDIVFGIIAE